MTTLKRRPTRGQVDRALRALEAIWRPPDKEKAAAPGRARAAFKNAIASNRNTVGKGAQ